MIVIEPIKGCLYILTGAHRILTFLVPIPHNTLILIVANASAFHSVPFRIDFGCNFESYVDYYVQEGVLYPSSER